MYKKININKPKAFGIYSLLFKLGVKSQRQAQLIILISSLFAITVSIFTLTNNTTDTPEYQPTSEDLKLMVNPINER